MIKNYILKTLFCLCLLSFNILNGQEHITPAITGKNIQPIWQDEPIYREHLKKQGISDAVINKLVEEKLILLKSGRQIRSILPNQSGNKKQPITFAPYADMGGENGWTSWQAQTGDYLDDLSGGGPSTLTFAAPGAPATPRFNLTSGGGIDPCTPGSGGPSLPVVAPGFGNASLQLGVPKQGGQNGGCNFGCAEQIVYSLNVTAKDTNFLYAYAYVIENPLHTIEDQPYVEFKILDSQGDTLPNSYQRHYGNSTTPGLFNSNASCLPIGGVTGDVKYKPWTTVGINLSNYVGQVVTVVVTNVDCSQGGHFAHSYWDFYCDSTIINNIKKYYCKTQDTILCAPTANSYAWSTGETTQCIHPQSQDTLEVRVFQGCSDYYITYIKSPKADFSFSANGGSVDFTDLSIGNIPVSGWNWGFAGGTPSYSTVMNPSTVTYPPGTYTVCLSITDTSGCEDAVCKTISIFPTDINYYHSAHSITVLPSFSSAGLYTITTLTQDVLIRKIEVYDVVGRKVKEYKMESMKSSAAYSIDLSSEKEGIYFLKINTGQINITKKIIKG